MNGSTILIADDNVGILKALTMRLEAQGAHVIPVQDGYQALECCRRERPDVAILDVNMPAGSGVSVQQRMSQLDELADIPVIYLTADHSQSLASQLESLGAVVLHKPVRLGDLFAAINAALDGQADDLAA